MGGHIIYHPNWDDFENKSAINNYAEATGVNWDYPGQTKSHDHPDYKPPLPPCLSSIHWSATEN